MLDVRWKQRYQNFQAALKTMAPIIASAEAGPLSEVEQLALIKSFEYCYELAWNLMKDYLEFEGITAVGSPRDAIRQAFKRGLIVEGQEWMEMIKTRNLTSHTYDRETAEKVIGEVIRINYPLFKKLDQKFTVFALDEQK